MTKLKSFTLGFAIIISTVLFNNLMHPKSILIIVIIASFLLFKLRQTKIHNKHIELLVGLYAILSVFSLLTSNIKNIGWDEITLEIASLVILIYLTRTEINRNKIVNLSAIILFIQSTISIFQFTLTEASRAAGTFLSTYTKANYFPNALGLFLVMTIPLSFYLKNKYLKYSSITLGTLALLLTLSRGALLVFIIQIIAIIIFEFHKNRKDALKSIACLTIAIFIFNTLLVVKNYNNTEKIDIKEKYTFSNTEKLTSINERAIFMEDSLKQILISPFSGWGPNTFSYIYPNIQEIWHANAPHPHNQILKISLERGIQTGIILIYILAYTIIYNFRSNFNPKTYLWVIALCGGILHNMIDYNLNFTINQIIFFALIAIIINSKPSIVSPSVNPNTIKKIFAILLFVPIIWTTNQILQTLANKFIAIKDPKHAILLLEKSFNSNLLLSNLYYETKQTKNAIITLNKEIKLNPYNHLAYARLGELLNTQESITYFKKALTIDPKNNVSYYYKYYYALKKYKSNKFLSEAKNAKNVLIGYLPFAINNIHYTAQNGNIQNAIKICNLYENIDSEFKTIKSDLVQAQKRFSSN